MASLKHTETLSNFYKKGFKDAENKSQDHIRVEFWYQNKLTRAKTKFSRNKQDINDGLIGLMSKQIYLTNKLFIKFAKCELSQSEYEDILKSRDII